MTATTPRPIRFRPLRRVILGILLVLLVVLLIMGTYTLVMRWYVTRNANREFDQAAAELDRSDPKWRWDDIEAGRQTLPPEQNGALILVAAAQQLPPSWSDQPGSVPAPGAAHPGPADPLPQSVPDRIWTDVPANGSVPPPLVAELLQEWRALAAPLAEARRLIDFPKGRAPLALALNPIETPMPQLDQLRQVALLLRLDALAQIEEGKPDAALNAVCALLNAAHSLVDEPSIRAYLTRTREVQTALGTAERVLARGQPSKDRLEALARLLDREEADAVPSLRAGLRGDRALFACQLERLANGSIPSPDQGFFARWKDWLSVRPVDAENRAPSLRLLTRLVKAVGLPRPQREQAIAEFEAERKSLAASPNGKLAAQFCVPGAAVFASHDRYVAAVRCARAAVAVEIFRRDHGRWPNTLSELVPTYLPAVPIDPFTDQPVRMELLNDGLVVYSVGTDGEDDVERRKEAWDHYNLRPFFRLWNPDKRGVSGP